MKLYSGDPLLGVAMTATAWDTEPGFDNLKVYDGQTTTATLLNTLSGATLPGVIRSSGNYLFLKVRDRWDRTVLGTGGGGAAVEEGRCGDGGGGGGGDSAVETQLVHTVSTWRRCPPPPTPQRWGSRDGANICPALSLLYCR